MYSFLSNLIKFLLGYIYLEFNFNSIKSICVVQYSMKKYFYCVNGFKNNHLQIYNDQNSKIYPRYCFKKKIVFCIKINLFTGLMIGSTQILYKMVNLRVLKQSTIVHLCFTISYFISGIILNFIQGILYIGLRPLNKSLYRKINYYLSYSFYSRKYANIFIL